MSVAAGQPEHEAGHVEQLHRQPPAHPQLTLVVRGVHAEPGVRGPVAQRVRAVAGDRLVRGGHVAAGLRHLLPVRVQHPAGDRDVAPRQPVQAGVRAQHLGEEPGADDLVRLRVQVVREDAAEQVGVVGPAAGDLRGQRRGGPGVQHVPLGGEAAGPVPLLRPVAGRAVHRRVDRQRVPVRPQRGGVVGLAVGTHRIPDRERHAEVPLPADQPVAGQPAHPVLVPGAHVLRGASAARDRGPAAPPAGPGRGCRCADTTGRSARSPPGAGRTRRRPPRAAPVAAPRAARRGRAAARPPGAARTPRSARPARRTALRARRPGTPRGSGRPGRARPGSAAPAPATRSRRSGRRRCTPWPARCPCPGRPAGARAPAPRPRRAGCAGCRPPAPHTAGRPGGPPPPRRPAAARAGWCPLCTVRRRGSARRRPPPGRPARPAPPRCRSPRPTPSARPPGTRRRGPGRAGRPAARCAGTARRWSSRPASSPPTARAAATPPRTPPRPPRPAAGTAR